MRIKECRKRTNGKFKRVVGKCAVIGAAEEEVATRNANARKSNKF